MQKDHPVTLARTLVQRFPVASLIATLTLGLALGVATGAGPRGRVETLNAELSATRETAARHQSERDAMIDQLEAERQDMQNQVSVLHGEVSALENELAALDSQASVPALGGLTLSAARDELQAAGLRVTVRKRASSEAPGTVLTQTPDAGAEAQQGDVVTLVVAKPRPTPPPQEEATDTGGGGSGGGPACDSNYSGCVPLVSGDLNCDDIVGPVTILGSDPHGFDGDSDGTGCES